MATRVNKAKMPCNKPRRAPKGSSKKSIVKACDKGIERVVRFGDPKMTIKKGTASRKKSYCARSGGIKGTSNKLSANYWSRKAWDC